MSVGLVRGGTFIYRRFKYRVVRFTAQGIVAVKVYHNDHTYTIPWSQLPKKLR